jgi:gamma-glutamylcyclotransferase (GGCT)/AIG2-like uncharacterized protein YtfP
LTAKPLFVYGTLRDPDILDALLGRVLPPHQRIPAHAPGFEAVHYPQRVYPALILAPDGNAPGLVLFDLTPVELAILDAFEGNEYRRDTITVKTPSGSLDADVYLPVITVPPDAAPWTLDAWTRAHKPQVLGGEQRTAAALRERLTAAGKPDA